MKEKQKNEREHNWENGLPLVRNLRESLHTQGALNIYVLTELNFELGLDSREWCRENGADNVIEKEKEKQIRLVSVYTYI